MLHKLKHKSLPEISYRAAKLLRKKVEALTFNPDTISKTLSRIERCASKEAFLKRSDRPDFFFYSNRDEVRKIFLEQFSDQIERDIARAEKFYNLQFNFLGGYFSYNEKINWQADPITGKEYPNCFYQAIDIFSNDEVKDIKYVCEVNRHQYLIDLAKAYFFTGNEKYAQRVVDIWYDWMNNNPYKIGVNWTCGLEVGVRSYSWIWSFFFLLDSDLVDEKFINSFLRALYLHGKYLSENQSFYSSPYNHLIGETSALYMIGWLFPEFPEASRWAHSAWKTLVSQIGNQFHPDGMSVEQASFYHYFTLGFYLMPIIIRLQNQAPVPEKVMNYLKQIFEFGLYMTRPDGTTPGIGDIDNARSVYFNDPEHWDFRNFLALGAVLFHSGEFKYVAKRNWEDILWLLGIEGWETYQKIVARPPQCFARHFPASGYFVNRTGWEADDHFYWIDCGVISDGVFPDNTISAAHGHADILHFEISAFGKNFIIDTGFHNYKGNFEWHKYFRETIAHNCLIIDGKGQADHGDGLMEWSHVAEPEGVSIVLANEYSFFQGAHNAFHSLPGSPTHIRHMLFLNKELWLVADEVVGSGEHYIEAYLHFAPCEIREFSDFLSFSIDGVSLNVFFLGDKMNKDIREGGKKVDEGWISPLYRCAQPAPRIRFTRQTCLPFLHLMGFVPDRKGLFSLQSPEENSRKVHTENTVYTISLPDKKKNSQLEDIFTVEWKKEEEKFYLQLRKKEREYRLTLFKTAVDDKPVLLRDDKMEWEVNAKR